MYIDTHAHLNMPDYIDIEEVVSRAKDAGVRAIVNVGFDLPSSNAALDLSNKYDLMFSAPGVHPHDAASFGETELKALEKLASNPKVVAIGETGLDYYKNLSPKEAQIEAFRRHIGLAQKLDLPLIVHARESYEDVLRILHEENKGKLAGVMHCFSGDKRTAELTLDLGLYISFAGPITFKNAKDLREIAKFVPLDRILIETDCPYLAPDPFRGKRNEPSYIVHTAKKLSELKNIELEELSARIFENAKRAFPKINI